MTIKDWNIEAMTGYKPITTFYQDFSIADRFGSAAIRDTLKRGLEYANTDYKVKTELVMVLNWKVWEHYETNPTLGRLYLELYEDLRDECFSTFKDEALEYFIDTTD